MIMIGKVNQVWFQESKYGRVFVDIKVSPVFEFEIDENTKNKFIKIYGKKIKTIRKRRELYALKDIFFTKDSVYISKSNKEV